MNDDIRTYLNLIRSEHKKTILTENIDDTTKANIINMFKENIDETTQIESINLGDGKFSATGIISLEVRFEITINNNDNETICNIWFPNNIIELTQSIIDLLNKLFTFFNGQLKEYVRQNLI